MEDKEKDVEIDSQGDLSVPAPSGLSLPSPSDRHKSEEAIIRIRAEPPSDYVHVGDP